MLNIKSIRKQIQKKKEQKQRPALIEKLRANLKKTTEKAKCVMCEKLKPSDEMLMPLQCKLTYGEESAHRICRHDWFKPGGFAEESLSHKCPGCVKNMPLTKPLKPPTEVKLKPIKGKGGQEILEIVESD